MTEQSSLGTSGAKRSWRQLTVGLLIGAVVGLAIGGYCGFRYGVTFFSRMAAQGNLYHASLEIAGNLQALEALDQSDTSALKKGLELRLDLALVDFAIYSEMIPLCDPKITENLSLARSYRAKNPGPLQATTSAPYVAKALALCPSGSAH